MRGEGLQTLKINKEARLRQNESLYLYDPFTKLTRVKVYVLLIVALTYEDVA